MTAAVRVDDSTALRQTLEQLLPTIGAGAALNLLRSTPAPTCDRANVVVVGEPSTGKTSLINALFNRPALLPVTPTTAYVAIGGSRQEMVRAHHDDGRISIGQLAHLGAYLGAGADERVDHVEIGLDDPRLARLTLFDTPGVGGIDSAAAQLTLTALRDATAAVFVCSAAAKISLAERGFLAEAAARIDQIVFVLSKIDAYRDWEQILTENVETIRGDFHRFPTDRFGDLVFVPFSARLAEIGSERADPGLIQESGMGALWTRLTRISEMHSQLAELNSLRSIGSALQQAEVILTDRQQALETAGDTEFAAITGQVIELEQTGTTWRSKLNREFDSARDAVHLQMRGRIRRLRADCDTELQSRVDSKMIDDIEARVVTEVYALSQQLHADVREHVVEIARRTLVGVPGADAAAASFADQLPSRGETPSDYLRQRPPAPKDPSETLIGIHNAFVGSNIARTLITAVIGACGLTPIVPWVAPVTVAVGVLWWRLHKNARHRASDIAGLRNWISTCLGDAGTEISAEIDRQFRAASCSLHDAVDTAFKEALDTANAARKDLDRTREKVATDKSRLAPLKQSFDSRRRALLSADHPPTDRTEEPTTQHKEAPP